MIYRFASFEVDDSEFRLSQEGVPVVLEPKALRLLLFLVANPGRLLRKQELLDSVWFDSAVTENALTRSIALLRKTLNDKSREPRFIETVPTVGFRFIAPVVTEERSETSAKGESLTDENAATPSAPAETARSAGRVRTIAAIVLVGAILLAFPGWMLHGRLGGNQPIHSLAVLPLANLSGDASQDYFADGMTDELIAELAHVPGLRVVSQTIGAPDKGASPSLRKIAQELNVDAIVQGSIVRSGDKVRITAKLIDMRTNQHVWANSFEGPVGDILPLQDSVAQQIATQTRVALSSAEPARIAPARSVNPAAFDAYLRGRYFFQKRDIRPSVSYFKQAIALDPNYASAYAGLADALESSSALSVAQPQDVMPAGIAAAKRAIELDPNNGEAYSALGSIESMYEWNWAAAEKDILKGIELDPNNALAEMRYAVYLDAMGRPEEAVRSMRRAVVLDPLSFFMNRHLGSTLFFARHYEEALYYLQRAGEMEPDRADVVHNWISWIDEAKGLRDQAVKDDLASIGQDPTNDAPGSLRSLYQHDGWNAYWKARIQQMQSGRGACTPYFMAAAHLRLGEKDAAFTELNEAVDRKCLWAIWLKVDPLMDAARADPRYATLMRRVNLTTP